MTAGLTTHVLDTMRGTGAAGLRVILEGPGWSTPLEAVLNAQGRASLVSEPLLAGRYVLSFHVAAYHRALGVVLTEPPFLDIVPVAFGVCDGRSHYHVPLLLSPFGYSTYRGS